MDEAITEILSAQPRGHALEEDIAEIERD